MPGRSTRVVVVRHGETAWNVDTRIQGQLDIALNDVGRWQAVRVAAALEDEGLDAIYSSDLARAQQTAQSVADATGVRLQLDAGLRERGFGAFEGRTYAEIAAAWPEQSERWRHRDIEFAPEGGESLRTFYARCVGTAERLAAGHPGQTVLLVAHGGVLDCLYRAAARIELQGPRSWQLGNARINRLLYTDAGFTLVGWNDGSHLDAPSLDESADGGRTAPLAPPALQLGRLG